MQNNKVGGGLSNLGNTCFFNAIMQVILYSEPFVYTLSEKKHSNSCQKKQWCVFCSLQNLWAETKRSRVVNPKNIVANLRVIFKKFRLGRQEDSHEYLRYLIEGLQDTETGKLGKDREANEKRIRRTNIYKVFGGRLRTFVLCLGCNHKSLTEERYYDINIECQRSNSLTEGISHFFRVDELTGVNKYRCQNCKHLNNAQKGFSILSLPNIFTFQFKRFTNSLRKIGKPINFPKHLNMHKYVCKTINIPEEDCQYELYGVTVHAGSTSYSGHYFSFIRPDITSNVWYEMNDSNVSRCQEQRVMNQQAYILFYVRVKKGRIISRQQMVEMQQSYAGVLEKNFEKVQRERKKSFEKQNQKLQKDVQKRSKTYEKNHENTKSHEEIKRKLSTEIQELKKSIVSHPPKKEQQKQQYNLILNGKSISSKKFGQPQLYSPRQQQSVAKSQKLNKEKKKLEVPQGLVRRRSKEQAIQELSLQQMLYKFSIHLMELQRKLPRNGIGHRALRSMNVLRRAEIQMKKRKIG